MKRFHLLIILLLSFFTVQSQNPSWNISLKSVYDDTSVPAEPQFGARYSSCWGYYDSLKNKSYGIIGSTKGTHFLDVTDPGNIKLVDFVAGKRDKCVWREYHSYKQYLYMVSDDPTPNSFQIADLSYLPDSVHIVMDSDSIFARSHTIFIDGDKLYCASPKGGTIGASPLAVYSLENPEKPKLLRHIYEDYTGLFNSGHDMFVRNDTIYMSAGYDGLHVLKFEDNKFTSLGSFTTYSDSKNRYNHSGVLSADGKVFVCANEVPSMEPVVIFDVSNLADIKIISTFESDTAATPHNIYRRGNLAFVASYQDGLQVFDFTDPSLAKRVGYFDTFTDNAIGFLPGAYQGNWGAYVDLPGGIILASDMKYGLFVLDANLVLSNNFKIPVSYEKMHAYPTLFRDYVNIEFPNQLGERWNIQLCDIVGRVVLKESRKTVIGEKLIKLNIPAQIVSGVYVLSISNGEATYVVKLLK